MDDWRNVPCDVDPAKGNRGGYVRRRFGGRPEYVHRKAWERAHGPVPEGMSVLHHCDNPPCKEVQHLFLGTQLDNVTDMMAKGRGRKAHGEQQGSAKLTEAQVAEIRDLYSTGKYTQSGLGRSFGVSQTTVRRIVLEFTWRHLA